MGLRRDLAAIKKFVDESMDPLSKDFDLRQVSDGLERKLFNCRLQSDEQCPGRRAYAALMQIARNAEGRNIRVQATFKDTRGTHYYLPIHLLRIDKDRLLADAIRINQPLPMRLGTTLPQGSCVSHWSAGLIVQDKALYNENSWREKWPEGLKKTINCKPFLKLTELRDYFRLEGPQKPGVPGVTGVPEGLVLLAHHGAGRIADREGQPEIDQIGPENIKRVFGPGSFAVLAACSVGALGEEQRDNSLFLHTLNERKVKAAVVSSFKVPASVAKRFLNALRETLNGLTINTTLYDVFKKSKEQYQKPSGDAYDWLVPMANLFMLVGDGDVMVCKPK